MIDCPFFRNITVGTIRHRRTRSQSTAALRSSILTIIVTSRVSSAIPSCRPETHTVSGTIEAGRKHQTGQSFTKWDQSSESRATAPAGRLQSTKRVIFPKFFNCMGLKSALSQPRTELETICNIGNIRTKSPIRI